MAIRYSLDEEMILDLRWYVQSIKTEDIPKFLLLLDQMRELAKSRLPAQSTNNHSVGKRA